MLDYDANPLIWLQRKLRGSFNSRGSQLLINGASNESRAHHQSSVPE
jgi:hypothetical protein